MLDHCEQIPVYLRQDASKQWLEQAPEALMRLLIPQISYLRLIRSGVSTVVNFYTHASCLLDGADGRPCYHQPLQY